MPFAANPGDTRFNRVECDLTDVLGTPGIADPTTLVDDLQRFTQQPWRQLASGEGLFLTSDVASAGAPAATTRVAVDVVLSSADASVGVSVLRSATGRHEVHEQQLRGAPVYGGLYRLHFGAESITFTGRPLGDLTERDPGPWPKAATDAAVRRAMRQALDLPPRTRIALTRVVFPLQGRGIWAVKGECVPRDPAADLRIIVRAEDLSLLLSYDVACSALFGEANVYPVSPSRTPRTAPAVLGDLGPAPTDQLRGAFLDVRPAGGGGIVRRDRDFRCAPDESGFDEVSVYANLQSAARWFSGVLGDGLFGEAPFAPLKVVTGDRTVQQAVGMFFPSSGLLRFGDGARPGTRSADIVIHEFAHAVADSVCRLTRSASAPAKALSEGFADYAASSALDDPRFGDYVQDAPRGARNCADPALRFPAVFTEQDRYQVGGVWAAVLWDIRTAVGAAVTDAIAFNSLYYLAPTCTVEEAAAALVKTDQDLFPDGNRGRHEDVITSCFQSRLPP